MLKLFILYIYIYTHTHTHTHIRFFLNSLKLSKTKTDQKRLHKLIINQKYWFLSSIQIYNPSKFPWIKSSLIKLKPLSLMSIRSEGKKRKTCSTVSHSSLNCTSSLLMTMWLSNHKNSDGSTLQITICIPVLQCIISPFTFQAEQQNTLFT